MARIRLFEKKLLLFKEVAIFSVILISFKIGFIVIVKYYFFPAFLAKKQLYGLREL